MTEQKSDLRSLSMEQIRQLLTGWGQPSFRAAQLFDWLHVKMVRSFDEMTNLPKALRGQLEEHCRLSNLTAERRYISRQDGTRKYVFVLPDGNAIESVLMLHDYGTTVCISSQVGCRMGCRFCASTLEGLARNLLPGEMLEEIYEIHRDIGQRISHVVVMGTGEPLDNRENLLMFLKLLTDPKGYGLSERNITVSTCGLVPGILALAEEKLQITLALSLHAPNDAIRRTMMPVAEAYTMEETLAACDEYFRKTGRRMSYEYSLVRGVNDRECDAAELSKRLRGKNCHVNLIPINPIRERSYEAPEESRAMAFKSVLENNGINATIRRKMGADIDSACGQLRLRRKSETGSSPGGTE